MANLTPTPIFDDVYEIDRDDIVDAGVNGDGIANKQAQQLANRTAFLKNKQDTQQQTLDGLGSAAQSDTSDFATAAQGAKADNAIPSSAKGTANGVATLDAAGKLPTNQLPALAINQVFEAASENAQLALTAEEGDYCVRSDEDGATYIRNSGTAGTMADWTPVNIQQAIATDAPTDSKQYARFNGSWSEIDFTAPQVEVTTSRDLTAADNNSILICTNANPIVLSMPTGLPNSFGCLILCTDARVHISDLDSPLTQDGNNTLTTAGHSASLVALTIGNNSSWLAGSLDDNFDVLQLPDGTAFQLPDNTPLEIKGA